MIGEIIPCPAFSHYDHCGHHPPDLVRTARAHLRCDLCQGARRVRVVFETDAEMRVEPAP